MTLLQIKAFSWNLAFSSIKRFLVLGRKRTKVVNEKSEKHKKVKAIK